MTDDIEVLRKEYGIHGLSKTLYSIIKRAVAVSVIRLRVPTWRAPDGRWDSDGISAVADEFIVEELPRDRLLALMDVARTTREFVRDLERLAADYLRRNAVRGPIANLREQTVRILESIPEFAPLSQRGKRSQWVWGLSGWKKEPPAFGDKGRARDAVRILQRAERPRYTPKANKRAPALRSSDLHRFLRELFDLTRQPWVLSDIVDLVVQTLALRDVEVALSIDTASAFGLEPASGDPDAAEVAEVHDMAKTFFSECSPEEHKILKALADEATGYEEMARRSEVSKATAWRTSRALAKRLADRLGDTDLAQQVWNEVMVLARTAKFLEEGLHG